MGVCPWDDQSSAVGWGALAYGHFPGGGLRLPHSGGLRVLCSHSRAGGTEHQCGMRSGASCPGPWALCLHPQNPGVQHARDGMAEAADADGVST